MPLGITSNNTIFRKKYFYCMLTFVYLFVDAIERVATLPVWVNLEQLLYI